MLKLVVEAALVEELEMLVVAGEELVAEERIVLLVGKDLVGKVVVPLLMVFAEVISNLLLLLLLILSIILVVEGMGLDVKNTVLDGFELVMEEGLTGEGVMLVGVKELVLLIVGDELVADVEVLLMEVVEIIDAVLLLVVSVESVLNDELDEELVS